MGRCEVRRDWGCVEDCGKHRVSNLEDVTLSGTGRVSTFVIVAPGENPTSHIAMDFSPVTSAVASSISANLKNSPCVQSPQRTVCVAAWTSWICSEEKTSQMEMLNGLL